MNRAARNTAINLLTWVLVLVFFFPVFWMVLNGFKPESVASSVNPTIFFTPTTEGFQTAMDRGMGAYLQNDAALNARNRDYVFSIFPRLRERIHQTAGTLSGGEQQMLAIGRALMGNPKFLMLDEPSLGIAPRLISTIFEKIVEINKSQGITILLVEQNANLALEISTYAYALETGHIVMEGESRSRNVVLEFKDYETALACYRSPEYQAAAALRKGKADFDLIVIEGYDGPQP